MVRDSSYWINKILIIGAEKDGEVVAEIFQEINTQGARVYEIVGFVDNNEKLWGKKQMGIEILGGISSIPKIKEEYKFHHLIISTVENTKSRKQLFEKYSSDEYSFINAIHPKAYVSPSAKIGNGNIICAFAYIGTGTVIEDDNFLGANTIIDNHGKIGNHCYFASKCCISRDVIVGDCCNFGSNVSIANSIKIGSNVSISIGKIVERDIGDDVEL